MNAHKTSNNWLVCVVIMLLLIGCSSGKEIVRVKVAPETLQEFSLWGDQVVIFTSAGNPISSLSEISVSTGEVGMWVPNSDLVFKFVKTFSHELSFLKTFGKEFFGLQSISAVGEGTKLFCDHPELRLFITLPDYEQYILDTGCGIEVIFEEE